jgi:hypothetical protein
MDNLGALLNNIARFLKALLDRFLSVLGFIDKTKNDLDAASEAQSEAAAAAANAE